MTYQGKVQNGVVVFDDGPVPPDGTPVSVEPTQKAASEDLADGSLASTLLELAGIVDDLPADMARNHDHYLHGHPRR